MVVLREQLSNRSLHLWTKLVEAALDPGQTGVVEVVVRRQRQHRLDRADYPGIVEAYVAGGTMKMLSERYDVHESTICLLLQREGIESRGRATVIHQHEAEVRRLRERGWSLQRIADRYECSTTTVWRLLRRP